MRVRNPWQGRISEPPAETGNQAALFLSAHLKASSNFWGFLANGRLEPTCQFVENWIAESGAQEERTALLILYDTRNTLPPVDC
jgi:hypothetical protein